MQIEANSKLVMIGDSITDFERARPVGEGLFGAMGKSYVALVDALLKTTYPERRIRVVNMGISGNTVRDLRARWQTDVLDLKPDWVSILIGNNDVWRQYDSPLLTEQHVYPEEYERVLRGLVEQTKPRTKQMVLMTPYFMEPRRDDPIRATMEVYAGIVKKIAEEYDTLFVDLQAAFDRYFEFYNAASINWDRVHPDPVGHMLIAKAFLKAIGFEWK